VDFSTCNILNSSSSSRREFGLNEETKLILLVTCHSKQRETKQLGVSSESADEKLWLSSERPEGIFLSYSCRQIKNKMHRTRHVKSKITQPRRWWGKSGGVTAPPALANCPPRRQPARSGLSLSGSGSSQVGGGRPRKNAPTLAALLFRTRRQGHNATKRGPKHPFQQTFHPFLFTPCAAPSISKIHKNKTVLEVYFD
jgi:hypothetical protein